MAATAATAAAAVAMAAAANNMTLTTGRLIGLLLLIGAFAGAFFLVQFFVSGNVSNSEQSSRAEWLTTTIEKQRSGDFAGALAEAEAVQNDPGSSAEEKALATYNTLGAQYRLTGDTDARLVDIQNMKKVILDETISVSTRVNMLEVLSKQYYISGRDSAVFAEIYKDAPFSTYLAPGDPDLSARRLAEWSYGMMPTSNAAITIARWYTEQRLLNPTQATSTTKVYAAAAEDYLAKADAASLAEAKADASYSNSRRYLFYRYWRTMIIGRLATQKGEPYQSQYRAAYEEFITFAQTQKNIIAEEYLLNARLFFAQRLVRNKDEASAKIQLDQLAKEMIAADNPDVNTFFLLLRNEYKNQPTGLTWTSVKNMSAVSPDFKAAVEKIVGPTSQ